VAKNNPVDVNRNERILAYMLASAIGLSILAIIAILVGTGVGVRDFDEGVWPVIIMLPNIGFPLGIILLVVLVVVSARRKSRAARDAGN
jgi:formate/nitrite transporter FocA (FNT family)